MKKFNILLIGLGSIGRRHIRILKQMTNCTIFVLRQKDKFKEDLPGVEDFFFHWDDLENLDIHFAVICNPPVFHINTALALAKKNIPFLMEKPVCVSMDNVSQLLVQIKERELPVLVGFNLRHHELYQKIKDLISSENLGTIHSFIAETGQYLPEWRDRDYTKSYSARKDLGGGVIFDLTHEIDLAIDILGKAKSLFCIKDKVSSLKINTEDIAEITLSHENGGISHLHLDYLQKEYTRKFKMIFEKGEITWDYAAGKIKFTSEKKNFELSQPENYTRENTFISQYEHWFEVLAKKERPAVSLEQGVHISEVAIGAHISSEKKRWITLD